MRLFSKFRRCLLACLLGAAAFGCQDDLNAGEAAGMDELSETLHSDGASDSDIDFLKLAIAMNTDGRLFSFVIKDDKACYYKSQMSAGTMSSTWPMGWCSLGAPENSQLNTTVTAARHSDGRLFVFSTRTDNGRLVYKRQLSPGSDDFCDWKQPSNYDFTIAGEVVATTNADGSIVVFGVNADDGYLYAMQRSSYWWQAPVKLGDKPIWGRKFAVEKDADERLTVFTSYTDGYAYALAQTGTATWSANYTQLGYFNVDPTADVAVTLNKEGLFRTFYSSYDGDIYISRELESGIWSPFQLVKYTGETVGDIGLISAEKRMTAATNENGYMFLVYAQEVENSEVGEDIAEKQHRLLYFYRDPNATAEDLLWKGPVRFTMSPVIIFEKYIETNNITAAHYSDGTLAFFCPQNYHIYSPPDWAQHHMTIQAIRQVDPFEATLKGWTPWYGLQSDASPQY